jgi:hypothetical protein
LTVRKRSSTDGYFEARDGLFFYFLSFLARIFQSGFVIKLNQRKKPIMHPRRVNKLDSRLKALLAIEKTVKKTKVSPPKQPVICRVRFNVIGT